MKNKYFSALGLMAGLGLAVLPATTASAAAPTASDTFHSIATEAFNHGDDVTAALEKAGYTEVTQPSVSPLSTGADVTMGAVQIFTTGGPIGSYNVLATYEWNDVTAKVLDSSSTDVFGVSLSEPRTVQSSSASFCSRAGTCTDIANPESLTQDGVAYAYSGTGSDSVRGTVSLTVDTAAACNFQAFSAYSHGWNEAVLSGVGIGRGSLSVSWNTVGQSFQIAGGPGNCT